MQSSCIAKVKLNDHCICAPLFQRGKYCLFPQQVYDLLGLLVQLLQVNDSISYKYMIIRYGLHTNRAVFLDG